LVEELKNISICNKSWYFLGIEDLKSGEKYSLIMDAEQLSIATIKHINVEITGVERFQRLIDTWHRTSERLKQKLLIILKPRIF
jgi:DNA-directed RNA polymerase subunit beta'